MTRPQCCGRNATPYTKIYKSSWWPSVESGFRCKVCGAIRIPWADKLDGAYMASLEAVRLSGIDFDRSLGIVYPD